MTTFIKIPFAQSGDKTPVPATDPAGGVNWTQGYGSAYSKDPATDPSAKRIEREMYNQVLNTITTAVNEIQSGGIVPFISTADNGGTPFAYKIGAVVNYNGSIYYNTVAANVALPTAANSGWQLLFSATTKLFGSIQVFATVGSGTFTVPAELKSGARKAKVTVIGGGGSGGRSSGGGGGGGGGIAVKVVDLTGVDSVTVVVGAGGPRPARGSTVIDGNGGNSSSFGSYLSATGGYSGGSVSGGQPGTGIGGDFNSSLGPGAPGASSGSNYVGGTGGGPGGAGTYSASTADGKDAVGPGGGGSGAAFGPTPAVCAPGSGANGIVIIEW